ncbi:primosomal protein N' [Lottiidibacillus patelloidae]|uniref:Replication restart protein PriA n=1 Tax=Lottiidibacillus patelloidae TaxID=2670334 RepID=A0A263BXS6_9BACI|nr:primosomal protein N' [Lottiidibacillus patelloidae]OZM58543.1 primosomal protein N' [Lottiidibacillus patelloidae]
MIAKVIVDVPTNQTDRPFDYEIPEKFISIIEPGMRVIVPFGPRKIQGFIVSVEEQSELKSLKKIIDVLDITPVLNEELINVGFWLTDKTLCFAISAFQVMLPAALKVKVQKDIVVNAGRENDLPEQIANKFSSGKSLPWDELMNDKEDIALIKQLLKKDIVTVRYNVKDRKQEKTVIFITPAISLEKLREEVKKLDRAKKQQEILQYFIEGGEETTVIQLCDRLGTTRSTIKALVNKQLLIEKEVEVYRDPFQEREFTKSNPLPLTTEQAKVLEPILTSIEDKKHETFLLHGVTGSGKTEVYLQAIDKVLRDGKEAIVLVPEISLTPQMVLRFKGRFGSKVAVFHSGLSQGEKYDEWRKIHRGEVKVVVGARSAVFAPFTNIGIIIIDEEHESSYKQEDNPRYHARDVAIFRGDIHQCPVVLGSATPSLESFARAKKGVYHLLSIAERVNETAMPEVDIVDMREELRQGNRSMFSEALLEKLKDRIAKKQQSVLFLNRRGFSTFVMCRECGFVVECPHCDLSLTYHRKSHAMKCHYCNFEERVSDLCPSCESEHIRFFGTGTQKVEEELAKVLPGARVLRMDVDTTKRKGAHEKILQAFGDQNADILLGTQMIAKGLDFPNVTLVGILAADTMLHLPDFRAAEKTFQLLTQVSGRAGRHKLLGEVVIQSYTPEHYSIQYASKHDYLGFYDAEMQMRYRLGYPPYYFVTLITVSHPNVVKAANVCEKIVSYLNNNLSDKSILLGPVVSPIARIKDRYRYQCMIKYKVESNLVSSLREIVKHYNKDIHNDRLQISIDLNPYMLM